MSARSLTYSGVVAGAVLAAGHERAVAHVQECRRQREEARYDAWVQAEVANARRLAAALAVERQENARLRQALAQRQAYIESMRRS